MVSIVRRPEMSCIKSSILIIDGAKEVEFIFSLRLSKRKTFALLFGKTIRQFDNSISDCERMVWLNLSKKVVEFIL